MHTFRDGLPGWITAGYPVNAPDPLPRVDVPVVLAKDLKQSLDSGEDLVLLDIRIPEEIASHSIDHPKRLELPFNNLLDRFREIPAGKMIVIVDVGGQRSPIAGRFLVSRGFSGVAFLSGGMHQWIAQGLPLKSRP